MPGAEASVLRALPGGVPAVAGEPVIRVKLPWACFGLVVVDAVVVEAAPIAKWAEGKPARQVWDYYARRGAELMWLPDPVGVGQ